MNTITVQLQKGNPYKSGSAIYLDINGIRRLQSIFSIEEYARIRGSFDYAAAEFAYFASVVYGCDRAVNRENYVGDRWTREFAVQIPVVDPNKWSHVSDLIESMLEFLTGDIWHFNFVTSAIPLFGQAFRTERNGFIDVKRIRGDAVSLFSGGLDSLVGIIDWLEDNPSSSIVLASSYDPQAENSKTDQQNLMPFLLRSYNNRIQRYLARTGLCADSQDKEKDINFRSRSLAFIGNAVLAASFLGEGTHIIIPENGAIALNYPLTPARRGSLSTRTVHPYFITMLDTLLNNLGLHYPLNNPYVMKTKGEMMQECRNANLLQASYPHSISCGKRGFGRKHWADRHACQCGVCVPCIFRQAAIQNCGFPAERYGYDVTSETVLRKILSQPNHDLSSVVDFIERNDDDNTIWRTLRSNAPLNVLQKRQYVSLIVRLRDEVKNWAQSMGIL